jgi:hypothetical protein
MFEPGHPRRKLAGQAVWAGVFLAATAVAAFVLVPSAAGFGTHRQLGLPPCPSMLAFGKPCPGCGLTTSWSSLLHGDVAGAFRAHPLGPVAYALFGAAALAALYGWFRGWRFMADTPVVNRAFGALVVAFVVFGVWRFVATPPVSLAARTGLAAQDGR